MRDRAIHHVWESSTASARIARELLRPASWIYGSVVSARNMAYDRGVFASHTLAIPAVSVGNLSVGGTGKTPVAAYVAARLAARGMKPAIVTRGYGGDEPLVHAKLNPDIPVIVGADRVRGALAARDAGCNVAVLDDAFQHRRARRNADLVLLSADLAGPVRALPAGPWREPLTSLTRASLIAVTRKSASAVRARELLLHARRFAPQAGGAVIHLAADRLVNWQSGEIAELKSLRGRDVLAVAAIGDPRAFASQLGDAGARVELAAERDHHAYSAGEVAELTRRAERCGMVICTLKDAVKLGPIWPRAAPPLWYLSQRVVVESGAADFDAMLTALGT
ncbi:MAG TPA: tetraacyldisaccharide 4'-kinase [Gemmatimonadaceae bacterium]|jgi:tetraacyldisaccharide 4'-kinase